MSLEPGVRQTMRVLIADDNPEIRSALRLVLRELSPHCAVDEAGAADESLALLEDLPPDLMLFDWELPGLDIVRLLDRVHRCSPGTRLVAMSSNPEARQPSLRAGASHFVGTNEPPELLLGLLRRLLAEDRA